MLGSYTDYDELSGQYRWLKADLSKVDRKGHPGDGMMAMEPLFYALGVDLDPYVHPKPEWSMFCEASFCHGELKIVNSTHAFWSWHRNDDDGPVRSDQVWITVTSLIGSE
ncbi:hypothetical protein V6N13_136774 [Hibiscus sabdariffa]